MSAVFDPYHKWLAIPPSEQPPSYYRLLGVQVFEADPDVISCAADQRMAHIRTFQGGPQSTFSQRLLDELSTARVCLLDRVRRARYDAELRERFAAQQVPLASQPVSAPTGQPTTATPLAAPVPASRRRSGRAAGASLSQRRKSQQFGFVLIAGVTLVAGVIIVRQMVRRDDSEQTATTDQRRSRPVTQTNAKKPSTPQATKKVATNLPARESVPERSTLDPPRSESRNSDLSKTELPATDVPASDSPPTDPPQPPVNESRDTESPPTFDMDELTARYNSASSPDEFRVLAEHALITGDRAVREGNRDIARQFMETALKSARKAGDARLATQATRRWLELQD